MGLRILSRTFAKEEENKKKMNGKKFGLAPNNRQASGCFTCRTSICSANLERLQAVNITFAKFFQSSFHMGLLLKQACDTAAGKNE